MKCGFHPKRKKRFIASFAVGALALGCIFAYQMISRPVGCSMDDLTAPLEAMTDDSEKAERSEKTVYLTFDDGPSSTTESILDILQQENVPATFFVIAAPNNEEYLPLLERTVAEGHMIALHTCTHDYEKIYQSPNSYWEDIDQLKERLSPYVDPQKLVWLRFPGGSTNTVSHKYGGSNIMKELKAQASEKGYHYVDWNVCADDAIGGHPSAEKIYNNVIRDVGDKNKCIVLMHDTKATKNTAEALPDIIRWFKNAGYKFDTIDHLEREI
ncbi:polysaccharide deacetylase family protein [uncultured Ruthenibacterium sp.]|uniref:polysaccharide deacetylase family protein n=1 Tax=uncultured Ruthenibacterium sp. TaxID=1905347 RepID=UPI00349E9812